MKDLGVTSGTLLVSIRKPTCPDRGRDSALDFTAHPSEPSTLFSRTRLTGRWFYLKMAEAKHDGHLQS
jgi:hypothetical protein